MDRARAARAIEAWQPLSAEPLTEADAEEIVEHMMGYIEVLRRWKEAADLRGASSEVDKEQSPPRQRRRRGS